MKTLTLTSMLVWAMHFLYAQDTELKISDFRPSGQDGQLMYKEYVVVGKTSHQIGENNRLRLKSFAGDIRVSQSEGDRVEVEAEFHLGSRKLSDAKQFFYEKIRLWFEEENGTLEFVAYFDVENESNDNLDFKAFFKTPICYIDLNIRVPKDVFLIVDDNSGDVFIQNLQNNLLVDDGAGDIRISDINGDVEIDDNSGNIIVKNVSGSLEIQDNSGDIHLSNISYGVTNQGEIKIVDYSGDIDAKDLFARIDISDTSGNIYFSESREEALLVDTSGDIVFRNAHKTVNVRSDGSGICHIDYVENSN